MEMRLDKTQIWEIFLFEFKMRGKATQAICNINNAFGPGTANELTAQWWFKKFCKWHESLEDEEDSGWPSEADNDQLRGSLNYMRSCQWTQRQWFYGHSAFEPNWKGEKAW